MKTKSEGEIGFIIINLAILTSILSFSLTDSISFVCKSVRYVFWVLSLLIVYRQARIKINFTAKYMVFTSVLFCSINILFCLLGLYPSFGGGIPGYIGFCALFYLVGFNFHWKTCSSIKTIKFCMKRSKFLINKKIVTVKQLFFIIFLHLFFQLFFQYVLRIQ